MGALRAVRSGEAALLRELRLRALRASPEAFASNAADEAAQPDAFWCDLATASAEADAAIVCVAIEGERWVGMAAGRWFDRDRGIAQLWGMWVDPASRREGLGGRLVSAVRAWAAGRGARFLRLGVIEGPDDVGEFYERLGFVRTGEERPIPQDPARRAFWLVRPV